MRSTYWDSVASLVVKQIDRPIFPAIYFHRLIHSKGAPIYCTCEVLKHPQEIQVESAQAKQYRWRQILDQDCQKIDQGITFLFPHSCPYLLRQPTYELMIVLYVEIHGSVNKDHQSVTFFFPIKLRKAATPAFHQQTLEQSHQMHMVTIPAPSMGSWSIWLLLCFSEARRSLVH